MKWKENFGFRQMFHGFTEELRAQEAEEMAADKDSQTIDGVQGEDYGRVIWSPAGDGRDLDSDIPLGNAISNPSVTSTMPLLTTFST
eukprot:CAMPEP_0172645386 /NCGR_PEP_ID=MMETSP1068-20121228/239705_1 /TAXON_ID=35684 /ORGANISM="Pseudopedinella elastica, Strain CCMP716" /LENGTH=86 /DNA_ID=CAMNT_0013459623 /DNA_START=832 /DNA_END=1092 /DNA_ORIENTATION=-